MPTVVQQNPGASPSSLPPLPRSPTPARRVTPHTASPSSSSSSSPWTSERGDRDHNNRSGPPSLEESSQSAASVDEDAIKTPRRRTATAPFASSPKAGPSTTTTSAAAAAAAAAASASSLAVSAWTRVILTPPAVRRQQQEESQYVSANQLFLDTMTGIKDAASGTYQGLKEWAKTTTTNNTPRSSSSPRQRHTVSPPSPRGATSSPTSPCHRTDQDTPYYSCDGTSAMKETMDDIHIWYHPPSKNDKKRSTSPGAATAEKILAAQQQQQRDPSHSPSRRSRSSQSSMHSEGGDSLLQDLAWPFMACVSTTTENNKNQLTNRNYNKSRKASKHGDNSNGTTAPTTPASYLMMAITAPYNTSKRNESFGAESIVTLDTLLEEEARQLQRLTSWGTAGTYGTIQTAESMLTDRTQTTFGSASATGSGAGSGVGVGGLSITTTEDHSVTASSATGTSKPLPLVIEDDDGNVINPVLLEKAQKKRQSHHSKHRRKRLVKFDYPPISSLRECPRADPNDLSNLFFTEEELEQMEEDRFSTLTADDVEIVAVGSPAESDVSSVSPAASFSNYKASPRNAQQQQQQQQQQGAESTQQQQQQQYQKATETQQQRKGAGPAEGQLSPRLSESATPTSPNNFRSPSPSDEGIASPKNNNNTSNKNSDGGGKSSRQANNNNNVPSNNNRRRRAATPRRQPAATAAAATSPPPEPHLIRGVQIYLRERSTPC